MAAMCPRILLALLALAAALPLAAADEGAGGGGETRRKPNRLAREKSPYLLQHAHNPVDWYPWGEEAFAAARDQGKPIFLSIGYSTCHWCHVMERESFEDEAIAARLNTDFIPIKVDREERPDVDEVYMAAVMATTGRGGWPLSAFLTPAGKPFFLGTYFPPRDTPGRGAGFLGILERVTEAWRTQRAEIDQSADRIAAYLQRDVGPRPAEGPWTLAHLRRGRDDFADAFDATHGGFGGAPKFPRTSVIDFLLAWHRLAGDARALEMATTTLEKMRRGGIYDHLGRGFHRYSTDVRWLVPHFEKMLYDQGLIASTYIDAHRLTGNAEFLVVALETLAYVLERMRDPAGGLYSAEDADSEGEEGKFYVFDRAEVIDVLGEKEGALFADYYGIAAAPNFEFGKSILHRDAPLDEVARRSGVEPAEALRIIALSRERLLAVRDRRVPPLKDDKVLADWNGMAIAALAKAHQATGERRWLEAAEAAAAFIRSKLVRDGKLLHRYRDGEARHAAYFEDYAFLADGLIELYEAGLDVRHLEEALRLARVMLSSFWDEKKGGFFHTGPEHETLIFRAREFYDGAVPSGNAVAARVLRRLADYTADAALRERAEAMARLGATLFGERAEGHPALLAAAAAGMMPRADVVIVAAPDDAAGEALLRAAQRRYLPHRVLARVAPAEWEKATRMLPWLAEAPAPAAGDAVAHAMARVGGGEFRRAATGAELEALLEAGAAASPPRPPR